MNFLRQESVKTLSVHSYRISLTFRVLALDVCKLFMKSTRALKSEI